MIYGVVISIITLWYDVITDYNQWLKDRNLYIPNGSINHKKGALIRMIGMLPAWLLISWSNGWWKLKILWPVDRSWQEIVLVIATYIVVAAMLFFWYITFFDGFLNQKMKEGFFRVGTTANTDKIQKNWPTWLKALVKIGGIILFTWLFIKCKHL